MMWLVSATAFYMVGDAVEDWFAKGLKRRDAQTVTTNRILAEKHVIPYLGRAQLTVLRTDDMDEWLDGLTGKLSTRFLQGVHSILKRSIRQAQARDKIERNVAELVTTPRGRAGRTSRALTLAQASAVLEQAESSPLRWEPARLSEPVSAPTWSATPKEGRTAWSADPGHRGPGATGRAAGP